MTATTIAAIESVNALLAGTTIAPIVIPEGDTTIPAPVVSDDTTVVEKWRSNPISDSQVKRIVGKAVKAGRKTAPFGDKKRFSLREESLRTLTAGEASDLHTIVKGF